MKFEDVEEARSQYANKLKEIKKKTTIIALSICLPLLLMIIIIAINLFSSYRIPSFQGLFFLLFWPAIIMIAVIILISAIIAAVVVSTSTSDEATKYKKAYKGYFIGQQLAKTFTDTKYNHNAGLDRRILDETGMIYTGDIYQSNDLTQGKYKNVDFAQADVTIRRKDEDSEGHTTYVTVFKGRYMVFEFPKKFSFRLMLTHSGAPRHEINPKDNTKALERMETESVDFNKAFLVYAEDGVEAFYILTPDFMERVQELGRSHNDCVSIYFANNKMIVGINDGDDIFEPPDPKEPLDEKAELESVGEEIKLIIDIVDNLKLNR